MVNEEQKQADMVHGNFSKYLRAIASTNFKFPFYEEEYSISILHDKSLQQGLGSHHQKISRSLIKQITAHTPASSTLKYNSL